MRITSSVEDLINKNQSDDDNITSQLDEKIKEITLKEKEQQTEKQAILAGLPYINLVGFAISPDSLTTLDRETAEKLKVICFLNNGQEIRLGTIAYNNEIKTLEKQLIEKYHANVSTYLISQNSFKTALKIYDNLPKVRKFVTGVEIKEEDLQKFQQEIANFRQLDEKIKKINITDVITLVLATGIKSEASDIHVEAEESNVAIRIRVDGVLQEAAGLNKDQWKKIISRLKILAKVKINITDKPQDGRFTIFLDQEKIEVRCSFLPTAYGESVVMRLLKSSTIGVGFEELGLLPQAYERLNEEIKKPNGLILTTGPTGSGKTTTLYAVLKKLNTPDIKVVTLEDPIEYKLQGINQSQVDPKKDYTFAKGLRSILRQDPDIVMVGEIRDLETAEISIQASLTGHLVLSTVHTNDASGAIPRLIDMGIKPFFLSPAINAIIGQRLVRKLCPKCRIEHQLSEPEKETIEKVIATISPKSNFDTPKTLPTIYKVGEGCEYCNGIGYKSRVGIYEILIMNEAVKELVSQEAPAFKILKQAIEDGMITMLQDGIIKIINGTTSLDEVLRVIGKLDYINDLYDIVISQTIGRGITIKAEEIDLGKKLAKKIRDIKNEIKDLPAKTMIGTVIATAVIGDAGDIHIEPTESSVKIRFRIDGILHTVAELEKEQYLPLLSNIKILAGFPTNIKKPTWDGRFAIFVDGQKMDSRVSIISGGYGETVVIRLLSQEAATLDFDQLGMEDYTISQLKKSMSKTKGIIVNTGPTGSGKTTTLYTILNKLNKPDIKIITVEDPIEYHLEGVMQTQVDVDQGYTFATAMRSLLRQNPNIMMIGEIRDQETAKVAIEASMTGHLVLSTIHANSAAGAISRFATLGIDRQLLSSSIESTIGQRLVRRVCSKCKKEIKPNEETLAKVKAVLDSIPQSTEVKIPAELKFYQGQGCEECGGLGYKGRLGIYEIIAMTPEMQKLIQQPGTTDYDIEQLATKEGAILMIQDGMLKAVSGQTTVEEILRVVE